MLVAALAMAAMHDAALGGGRTPLVHKEAPQTNTRRAEKLAIAAAKRERRNAKRLAKSVAGRLP
jgi:hypothetical protein